MLQKIDTELCKKLLIKNREFSILEVMKNYSLSLTVSFDTLTSLVKEGLIKESTSGIYHVTDDQKLLDDYLKNDLLVNHNVAMSQGLDFISKTRTRKEEIIDDISLMIKRKKKANTN